jgi:6-phosphogluconolactonase (cycloisomerase 2 family)
MFSRSLCYFLLLVLLAAGNGAVRAADSGDTRYVIANDDAALPLPNRVTFFKVGSGGVLSQSAAVETNGQGIGGGFFAAQRVVVEHSGSSSCAFASDAGSGDIAGIDIHTLKVTGNFKGSGSDTGITNGIGLAVNPNYLYASFTDSNNIGTFSVAAGCALAFVGNVAVEGLHKGVINGMKLHDDLLVVTYDDGSIESFEVSGGMPVSNGDEQDSTGRGGSNFPTGIDVTKDGHWAIFGDVSNTTVVEVSDLSSGKLSKTVVYHLGNAVGSANIFLSPDETLLYISNTQGDRLTAARFDATTGKLSKGCKSGSLKGYGSKWAYLASLATETDSGTGGAVYAAEFGAPSSIAIVDVKSSGGACTLKESAKSPVQCGGSLLSIAGFPSRSF